MGGVVGTLLGLYCRSGCQASVVASALAFHPPDPQYTLQYDEATKTYAIQFVDSVSQTAQLNMKVDMLSPKRGMKVPLIVITHPNAKFTILYSHGNATDCGAMFPMYAMMAMYLKVNIVGYDYTGYGASKDSGIAPTEKQTYRDIKAVYDYCISTKLVTEPSKEIILYGQSVGSGPSCYLASRLPVAALVLHSPIMSGLRVITDSRALACFDIFPNIRRIRSINAPLFVIHGKDDMEVTFKHGTSLLAAAPESCRYEPWWVDQRGHNDVLQRNEAEFISRMEAFLKHVTAFEQNKAAAKAATAAAKKGGAKDKDATVIDMQVVTA